MQDIEDSNPAANSFPEVGSPVFSFTLPSVIPKRETVFQNIFLRATNPPFGTLENNGCIIVPSLPARMYVEAAFVVSESISLAFPSIPASRSPLDIATKWEAWARNPKNKEQYIIAQDRIQETLDWMGGSTIFNKSMIDLVRKTNFQSLAGYANGQVNKALTDIGRFIGAIETGK